MERSFQVLSNLSPRRIPILLPPAVAQGAGSRERFRGETCRSPARPEPVALYQDVTQTNPVRHECPLSTSPRCPSARRVVRQTHGFAVVYTKTSSVWQNEACGVAQTQPAAGTGTA